MSDVHVSEYVEFARFQPKLTFYYSTNVFFHLFVRQNCCSDKTLGLWD